MFLKFVVIIFFLFQKIQIFSVQIIATVGNEVIFDTEIQDAAKIICFISKNKNKNCQLESKNDAFGLLIDLKSKEAFFKSIKINFEDFQIKTEQLYTMNKIQESDLIAKQISISMFNSYLIIQFLWSQYVLSALKNYKIKENDIKEFQKSNPNLNEEEIKNKIFLKKLEETSAKLSEQIKEKLILEIR